MQLDNSNISKHLGQTSKYKSKYDPELLVREPRSSNRQHLGVVDSNLPFTGYDTWNAYEVSCLNANGVPITGFAKITYPCSNAYIVESKSLKLYLNSFNMTYFTSNVRSDIYRRQGYNDQSVTEQKYHSSLLKSNCRVTSQPDWGDVYIYYKGSHSINPSSLLKYIVSFRDECHFHEEICETIYKRISDKFAPHELTVTCLYVRRGGIDINPIRSSKENNIYKVFTDPNVLFKKTARQ